MRINCVFQSDVTWILNEDWRIELGGRKKRERNEEESRIHLGFESQPWFQTISPQSANMLQFNLKKIKRGTLGQDGSLPRRSSFDGLAALSHRVNYCPLPCVGTSSAIHSWHRAYHTDRRRISWAKKHYESKKIGYGRRKSEKHITFPKYFLGWSALSIQQFKKRTRLSSFDKRIKNRERAPAEEPTLINHPSAM